MRGRATARSGGARTVGRWSGLAIAALVTVTGCTTDAGSSAGESSAASAADIPSASDGAVGGYAGDFDAVTQGFRARSEDLQARIDTTTSDVEEILAFYRELRLVAADAREEYGALTVPSQVQSVNQQILQLFDRQVALLDDLIAAGERDDQAALTAAVQGLVDLTEEFGEARQAVQAAIAECGRPCMS